MTPFPINVFIRKVATGEVRIYQSEGYEEDGVFCDYIWRDGNFACDCNRELFFERAAGNEISDEECGDGLFVVESIVRLSDGAVLYTEGK